MIKVKTDRQITTSNQSSFDELNPIFYLWPKNKFFFCRKNKQKKAQLKGKTKK